MLVRLPTYGSMDTVTRRVGHLGTGSGGFVAAEGPCGALPPLSRTTEIRLRSVLRNILIRTIKICFQEIFQECLRNTSSIYVYTELLLYYYNSWV